MTGDDALAAAQGRREYPDALKRAERRWCDLRRRAVNEDAGDDDARKIPDGAPTVGLALSGGGIRSATFGFGVVQAMIKAGVLHRVDYLSTVSGGGYFGGFLGRLYSRHYATPKVVEYLLHPQRADRPRPAWNADAATDAVTQRNLARVDPFSWLRSNGRYLAPNGLGDVVLAFSVAIRNWVALHLVLWSFLLIPLMAAQLLRRGVMESRLGSWLARLPEGLSGHLNDGGGALLTWSVYADLIPPLILIVVLPLGWAYWMVERWRPRKEPHPVLGAGLVIAIAAVALSRTPPKSFDWWQPLFAGVIVSACLALLALVVTYRIARQQVRDVGETASTIEDVHANARNAVSLGLARVIKAVLVFTAFVLIDSLGQTLYRNIAGDDVTTTAWTSALAAALMPFAIRLSRLPALISTLSGGKDKDKRAISLPMNLIAGLVAAALVVIVLSGLDAFAIALVNGLTPPEQAPRHTWLPICAGIAILLFAWLFGHTFPFLNRSAQSVLYTARLVRSYLGASNWRRFTRERSASVADAIAGDDIVPDAYFGKINAHGGPLHLINVTINETTGANAKSVLRDRKGIALAIGPCGYSAGVRHHALHLREWLRDNDGSALPKGCDEGRAQIVAIRSGSEYSMFCRSDVCGHSLNETEQLTIGQWIAISGAAFTTGLGMHTSIGLSLLLGFANVRLGHWWDAGNRLCRTWLDPRVVVQRLFPVQSYLLDELTATFRGPAARRWYLSDGGHFENMGAYELIRRHVPMIVIVDGETDDDYTYEGLGNLVRKARLDFHAEIEFLKRDALDRVLQPKLRAVFGDLDGLRPDAGGFSKHHAALATVRYIGSRDQSLIVYIKATLSTDDPTDVREYRAKNPDFPQQSTLNQFFDESQWESYRKLGEVVGSRVFAKPESDDDRFAPASLWPRFEAVNEALSAGSSGSSSLRGWRAGRP